MPEVDFPKTHRPILFAVREPGKLSGVGKDGLKLPDRSAKALSRIGNGRSSHHTHAPTKMMQLPASDSNLVIRELLALQKENKELRRALGQKRGGGPRPQKTSSKPGTGLQPGSLPAAIERALQDAHQMIQASTSADKADLFKDYEATKRFVGRWQGLPLP